MNDLAEIDDPYHNIAELYDLEHDGFRDDISFYLQSISVVGDPVLELGCGSGRLLQPIAMAGHQVTGIDRSSAMLMRAESRLLPDSARKRMILHAGDMASAGNAPGGPFGVAIFSLNGLLHLTTQAEQIEALRAVREAMDPRGQVLIDLLNPTVELLRRLDGGVVLEGTWWKPDGTRVDKFSTRQVISSAQAIHTTIWYDEAAPAGAIRRHYSSFDLRYLHLAELELMLRIAGHTEWQVYGSYDLDPYEEASERLIIAAEASG